MLRSVYRGTHQYDKLIETHLDDDEDQHSVFECLDDIIRPNKGLAKKQLNDVKVVISNRAREFVAIDAQQIARTLKQHLPDLLETVLTATADDSDAQFRFLAALIEPDYGPVGQTKAIDESVPPGFLERYVQLLCKHDATRVADFVSLLQSGDLRIESVLPALETSGAIDAAVILLARDGLVQDAMSRLVKHLETLENALHGLISAAAESPDVANTEEAIHAILEDIHKYLKSGIWLCQGQTRSAGRGTESLIDRRKSAYGDVRESDLALDELLWLELIDTAVRLIRNTSSAVADFDVAIVSSDTQS